MYLSLICKVFKSKHMILKIVKGIWFFSLLIFLAVFFFNYAGLPESITVFEADAPFVMSKEGLFYAFLALVAIMNMFVFVISRIFPEKDFEFKTWFYGLIITLNIFFIVGINFIGLYNSSEKFDYPRIGNIIYGSLVLIVIWTVSWPVYALSRKYIFKQTV